MINDLIVVAMTESDAHVVSCKLLQLYLEENGKLVINLGACAPLEEVIQCAHQNQASCIMFGTQNGHALEDLSELNRLKTKYRLDIPILLGGNLSVGSRKNQATHEKLIESGVDYIVDTFESAMAVIERLNSQSEVSYG